MIDIFSKIELKDFYSLEEKPMKNKIVETIKMGRILSIDWQEIDEMLGENPEHKITCSICSGISFPPAPEETYELSEEEAMEVIRQSGVQWMSFDFVDGTPLSRFKTRYFSVNEPAVGQWLKNPSA